MLVVCKKCKVEHDARDVNNGVCFWCEQKENAESVSLQYIQAKNWTKYNLVFDKVRPSVYTRSIK